MPWNRDKHVAGLNWLIGSQTSRSPMTIQYIKKYKKPLQIYSHSKRTHTMTKLNDKINMDNTTAGSMNAYS